MWIIFYMAHSVLVRICIKSEVQMNEAVLQCKKTPASIESPAPLPAV